MPIYDYLCTACDHRADILHGINDPGPRFCPSCGAEATMRKQFAAPAIHFKGSGWAKKDRGSSGATKAAAKTSSSESREGESRQGESRNESRSESREGESRQGESGNESRSKSRSDSQSESGQGKSGSESRSDSRESKPSEAPSSAATDSPKPSTTD